LSLAPLHLVVPGALEQRTGGYIYDSRICAGLRRIGWSVQVHELAGHFPGPDREAEQALDHTLRQLPDGSAVVIDGLALGGLPRPAEAHGRRLALIGLVHHPLAEETALPPPRVAELRELEQRALAACRAVIVTSPFTAALLRPWLQASTPVRVVIPGTEPAPRARPRAPEYAAPPLLLCVGSVVPRKGQDLLVQALGRLPDRAWKCVLAGSTGRDPAFVQAVRAEAGRLGIADRVRFAGECSAEELEALYQSASLFVLPSWYEGYGMAFTEAMAHRLPILATNGGAIPHTVPSQAALLVPTGDVDALAAALVRLLDEPGLRQDLAEGALAHARTLPDWHQASAAFAAAVNELAAR
jgi:glycosyltransferase involved in cell wall biosynthesis